MTRWRAAASTTFLFNYERPGCESGIAPTGQTVTGSSLLATWSPSDMTLFEMTNELLVDWDAYYSGWSRSTTSGSWWWRQTQRTATWRAGFPDTFPMTRIVSSRT